MVNFLNSFHRILEVGDLYQRVVTLGHFEAGSRDDCVGGERSAGPLFLVSHTCPSGGRFTRLMNAHLLTISAVAKSSEVVVHWYC